MNRSPEPEFPYSIHPKAPSPNLGADPPSLPPSLSHPALPSSPGRIPQPLLEADPFPCFGGSRVGRVRTLTTNSNLTEGLIGHKLPPMEQTGPGSITARSEAPPDPHGGGAIGRTAGSPGSRACASSQKGARGSHLPTAEHARLQGDLWLYYS